MHTLAAADAVDVRAADEPGSPRRVFLPRVARERFSYVAQVRDRLSDALRIVTGYSIKTNPRRELLSLALAHGFNAEAISPDEVGWARACGFPGDRIVYGGPWPLSADAGEVAVAAADSVEGVRSLRAARARTIGVRLRPSVAGPRSRFGVPPSEHDALCAVLAEGGAQTHIVVAFHVRRDDLGDATWRDACADVIARAAALERDAGVVVDALDVGGGWSADAFDADFVEDARWIFGRMRATLPAARELIVEPGQAIAAPAEALIAHVLEVRRRAGATEAILDLGYGAWPEMHRARHAFFVRDGERWTPLGPGGDRFGGATCLEWDLVDGFAFPQTLAAGDAILVTGTGAYDASMSFPFGIGGERTAAAVEAVA